MNVTVENEIKIIRMGDKGPNLLGVEKAKEIIKELNYHECKAVIILGNEKVFSAGLNLKDLMSAKKTVNCKVHIHSGWSMRTIYKLSLIHI